MIRSENIATKRVFNEQKKVTKKYAISIDLQWPFETNEIETTQKRLKANTNK